MEKSLKLQKQIVDNSRSITEFYKDLFQWEKEINDKDKIINTNFKQPVQNKIETEPIKEEINSNSNHSTIHSTEKTGTKLKRDINSIGDYYNHWDKFDVDSENNTDISDKNKSMMEYKNSSAKANTNVVITNNRMVNTNTEDYIEKLKNEANAYFSIKNYNKSIELYNSAVKLIENDKSKKTEKIKVVIYNNKGNCYLKSHLFKEAINDFDYVIRIDKENTKAYFRRGFAYYSLNNFSQALEDFSAAYKLSVENEKETVKDHINNCIGGINMIITKEKKKMESFEYSDNFRFKKVGVSELNDINLYKDEYKNISMSDYLKGNINKKILDNNDSNLRKQIQNNKENTNNINNYVKTKTSNVMKNEEIVQFVYDITKENLSASSFKYALRHFSNIKEKEDYLLKINPAYLPKIFINDIDKETLLDIFKCLKNILSRSRESENEKVNENETDYNNEYIAAEYMKNITKINRFKLVLKLMQKKEKIIINEIFDLIKNIPESDLISVKDSYVN